MQGKEGTIFISMIQPHFLATKEFAMEMNLFTRTKMPMIFYEIDIPGFPIGNRTQNHYIIQSNIVIKQDQISSSAFSEKDS